MRNNLKNTTLFTEQSLELRNLSTQHSAYGMHRYRRYYFFNIQSEDDQSGR